MSLLTNLVAYYKLDESSGNASDSINSNTLTNHGTITYSAGKINNGANLVAASSQYFTAADSPSLSITDNFTFSFWIKPTTIPSVDGTYSFIINKDDIASQRSYALQINQLSGVKNFTLDLYQTATGSIYSSIKWAYTLSTGVWTHVAIATTIANSITTKCELFINGSSQGNGSGTEGGGGATSIYDGTAIFEVGARSSAHYLNSSLDEIGIWSRTLTSAEITTLYNSGNGIQYPFGITNSNGNFLSFM